MRVKFCDTLHLTTATWGLVAGMGSMFLEALLSSIFRVQESGVFLVGYVAFFVGWWCAGRGGVRSGWAALAEACAACWGYALGFVIPVWATAGFRGFLWGSFALALAAGPLVLHVVEIGARSAERIVAGSLRTGLVALCLVFAVSMSLRWFVGERTRFGGPLQGHFDLAVGIVDVIPGKSVRYSVLNIGPSDIPAGYYSVELHIDGRLRAVDRAMLGFLAASSQVYEVKLKGSEKTGTHSYRVEVDPQGRLSELREDNNTAVGEWGD